MAQCEGCGAQLVENARFCTCCGKPVPQEAIPATRLCASCGAALLPDARFCEKCGARVVPAAAPASPELLTALSLEETPMVDDDADAPYPLEGALPFPDEVDTAIRAQGEAIRKLAQELIESNVDAPASVGESILSSWLGE